MLISCVKPWAVPDQASLHDELAARTFQLKHVTRGKSCWIVFNDADGECLDSAFQLCSTQTLMAPERKCLYGNSALAVYQSMIMYKN